MNKTKPSLLHERGQGISMLSEAEFKLSLEFNSKPKFSILIKLHALEPNFESRPSCSVQGPDLNSQLICSVQDSVRDCCSPWLSTHFRQQLLAFGVKTWFQGRMSNYQTTFLENIQITDIFIVIEQFLSCRSLQCSYYVF